MIVMTEGKTPAQMSEAEKVLDLLSTVYPGHPWAVRVDDGIIFIRHLQFGSNGWGMNLRTREVEHDAAVLRRQIVMLAGEWLERAGLKRGRYEAPYEDYRVEGVPEKYQPPSLRKPDKETPQMEIVVAENKEVREEPRPQALKADG